MKKAEIAGLLSLVSFIAILFLPQGSNYWIYAAILGIVFGAIWWVKK